MTTIPGCFDEAAVPLTGRDIWVVRLGLRTLLASSTRHEHVYHGHSHRAREASRVA